MTEEIRADYTKRRSERGIKFKRAEHLNVKRLIEKCQYLSTMYHAEAGGF